MLSTLFIIACLAAKADPTAETRLAVSQALGMEAAQRIQRLGVDVDAAAFRSALEAALAGRQAPLSREEARRVLERLEETSIRAQAELNRAPGLAFLAENRKRPGVVVHPSGLHMEVLAQGQGPRPRLDQVVRVHYRGTRIDGTEFDSTLGRKEPARLRVAKVIDGWSEALLRMNIGTRVRLVLPWELAYGERGRGELPGCAVLVFEMELVGIEPGPLEGLR